MIIENSAEENASRIEEGDLARLDRNRVVLL